MAEENTVLGWGKKLRQKELSVTELTKEYLKRIEEKDKEIRAFLLVTGEEALEKAKKLDALPENEKFTSPLWGIPYGAKDNICTKNIETTAASRILEGYIPPYNATVIERLEKAGAVLIGKTNMDEFAMGSSTENSAYFPTRNPLDMERVPGGSSGGSAAAVASKTVPFTLGSDTGGSVRQPSSFCGTVGIKPTYGAVSRYGMVAFASSFDQIGPISETVYDNYLVFKKIKGQDERDRTSLEDYETKIENLTDLKGFRIGVPKEFLENISPAAFETVENMAKQGVALGATVEECSVPSLKYILEAYYALTSLEMTSNLGRYDGLRYGRKEEGFFETANDLYRNTRGRFLGKEVIYRTLLGNMMLGKYQDLYAFFESIRQKHREEFDLLLSKYDLLLLPGASDVATKKRGAPLSEEEKGYLWDRSTASANMTGLPSICFRGRKEGEGLPIGVQLMASGKREDLLYSVAKLFEERCEGESI